MFGRKGQDEAPVQQREQSLRESAGAARDSAALEAAFRETADPRNYVPRDSTESALRELDRWLSESGRPVGLQAAPGMGKSMLLRVLAQRLASRRRCVFLPYGSLALEDLCAWALGIMGEPGASDPADALLSVAWELHSQDSALVLLIDDASGLRREVAGELCALQAGSSGALQLVLALPDLADASPEDASPEEMAGAPALAAMDSLVDWVQLEGPMTLAETSDLLRARLDRAGVPKVVQNRMDRASLETLYRQSRGVPRLALRAGHRMLAELPADICSSWHQDDEWPAERDR